MQKQIFNPIPSMPPLPKIPQGAGGGILGESPSPFPECDTNRKHFIHFWEAVELQKIKIFKHTNIY